MSVTSGVRPAGAVLGLSVSPDDLADPQDALLAEMIGFLTKDTPSAQHVLDLATPHLVAAAGLTAATVFDLDSETGLLKPAAQFGEPGRRDMLTAGKVFRMAAGAAPLVTGEQMAIRLRIGGQTVGVLLLTGPELAGLRAEVLAPVALHFATTLQGLAAEKQRQFSSHVSSTIRKLFEQGMVATSVEEAGRLLATSTAEAFRAERGAMYLIDQDKRITYVHGVGLGEGAHAIDDLVGKLATDSPVWRSIETGRPALVGDASTAQVRKNGLVRAMGLSSFLAMPLMSAQGPVGMVLCGDTAGVREWSSGDRGLAEQLSVEGTLIIDSAEMRHAAQEHVAELSHQAFHDSLTGLPNRKHLRDAAQNAIDLAGATTGQVALMLLDLNGFKQVNDTAGHHAGDILLQQVAKRLSGAIRDADMVSRLGGDEFAVLVGADPDERVAADVAQRICDRLRQPFLIDGQQLTIGASVGFAMFPHDGTDYDSLMRGADEAMYEAKHETKRFGGGFRRAHG